MDDPPDQEGAAGRPVHSAQVSLDGFITDRSGAFDFRHPDDEVHAFVDDSLRPIGTHLHGRRLYDGMVSWETVPDDSSVPPVVRDVGRMWRGVEEVVHSRTLDRVASGRTTPEREFAPDAVRGRTAGSDADLLIGGAHLAATAWDEDVQGRLQLREEQRSGSGVVHLRYDVVHGG